MIHNRESRAMPLLPNQRHLFDIPRDVAYLNCAFMGPLLTAARLNVPLKAGQTVVLAAEAAERIAAEAAPEALRSPHYLGVRLPGGVPEGFAQALAARNVHLSLRGDRVRVTPHLYNDEEDISRLFAAVEDSLRRAA